MKKYAPITGFVLVALFAMSCFAPLSNGTIEHDSLSIIVTIDGNDLTPYQSASTPYVITAGETVEVDIAFWNAGPDITLSSLTVEFYHRITILGIIPWETKVYETDSVYSGTLHTGGDDVTFNLGTDPEYAGQNYKVVALLDFEPIDDLTITFYISFA